MNEIPGGQVNAKYFTFTPVFDSRNYVLYAEVTLELLEFI